MKNSRVYSGVVAPVRPNVLVEKLSVKFRQPVLVGDLLNDGTHDLAAELVDLLIFGLWIHFGYVPGTAVVLTDPNGVHYEETCLLIGADVASKEAVCSSHADHQFLGFLGDGGKR